MIIPLKFFKGTSVDGKNKNLKIGQNYGQGIEKLK